jgi:hypothetical protein
MHKQDPTVPESRLLFFLLREISRNLITLRYGEFPTPRFDRDLSAIELDNLDGLYTQARQAALGDGLGKGTMGSRPRRYAVDDPLGRQLWLSGKMAVAAAPMVLCGIATASAVTE